MAKVTNKALMEAFINTLPDTVDSNEAFENFCMQNPGTTVRKGDLAHQIRLTGRDTVNGRRAVSTVGVAQRATGIRPIPEAAEPMSLEMVKAKNLNYDPKNIIPLKTNTAFDQLATKAGGIMLYTVNMVTGESGAGKTTVCTNLADYLKEVNPEIEPTFISGEMDQTDWIVECADNPRLLDLNTVFLLDYLDAPNYVDLLKQALSSSKCIIVDSFEVILDQLKEVGGYTAKKAEAELIKILRQSAAEGRCLLVIQQYTKSGTYVGSTKIKHLTTSMIYVMFDKDGQRYVIFTKNRRNGSMVNRRLYFTKNRETGRVEFDGMRFSNENQAYEFKESEKHRLLEESLAFEMTMQMQDNEEVEESEDGISGWSDLNEGEQSLAS
jgi:predicted ATP-dependent serine protease